MIDGPADQRTDPGGETLLSGAPQRLHPLTLLLAIVRLGPQSLNIVPALIGIGVVGRWSLIGPMLGGFLILSLLYSWVAWVRFSWRVDADDISIISGVLSRNSRTIPFDRIQDVNIEQGLVARVLGLAKVTLETGSAGSGKGEDGALDAIGLAEANALRDHIRSHRMVPAAHPAIAAAAPDTGAASVDAIPLFTMGPGRLLTAGLFNFSLAIFAVLFGVLQSFDDILPFDPFSPQMWIDLVAGTALQSWVEAHRWLAVVGGGVSLILLGIATGIIRSFVRDWGFVLERTPRGFRRQRGLTTRTDVAIPVARVQAALVETGFIRRRFGWYTLKLQSLAQDGKNEPDYVVAPFATLAEIDAILDQLSLSRAGLEERAPGWERVHPILMLGSLTAGIILIIAAMVVPSYIEWFRDLGPAQLAARIAPLVVAILLLLTGLFEWRAQRWRFVDGVVHVASGLVTRHHAILPARHVQSADIAIGPVTRLFDVAALKFGVAGARHALIGVDQRRLRALRHTILATRGA